jgi:hypothetical protein
MVKHNLKSQRRQQKDSREVYVMIVLVLDGWVD